MLLTALAWQLASAALLAQDHNFRFESLYGCRQTEPSFLKEPVKPTTFVNTPDFKAKRVTTTAQCRT